MENKVLAKVNGKEITERNLQSAISSFPRERQTFVNSEKGKAQVLEQLISFELYYNYAEDSKLEESPEFIKRIDAVKKQILTQMAIENVLSEVKVTDDEAKDYYEANKNGFKVDETVVARHILVKTEELAKEIAEKIKNGMNFEDAAKEYSECPSKAQGGSLGKFGKGQMVPEFEKEAFTLEIGQVSEPVKTQFGYHLIKVENREEPAIKTFDQVKDMIKATLLQERQGHKYNTFLEELKKKFTVTME